MKFNLELCPTLDLTELFFFDKNNQIICICDLEKALCTAPFIRAWDRQLEKHWTPHPKWLWSGKKKCTF